MSGISDRATSVQVEMIPVGPFQSNCLLVSDRATGYVLIVDPGADADRIIRAVDAKGYEPHLILNTHGHVDHIGANDELRAHWEIPLIIHEADAGALGDSERNLSSLMGTPRRWRPQDRTIVDGDRISVGTRQLLVIHTPGHTPGSICALCDGCLLSGDTLFAGSVGRSDLPGGDGQVLRTTLDRLVDRIPAATMVYPGHGPATTMERERTTNPFLSGRG